MIVRSPPYLAEDAGVALVADGGLVAAGEVAGGGVVVEGVVVDWLHASVATIKAANRTVKNSIRFMLEYSSLSKIIFGVIVLDL